MVYYTALQLPRNATAEEIKRAYRKLALAAHPERATSTDSADVEDNFNLIAEAYDVLSHPARRGIYDQFGEKGLKEGVPDGRGNVNGGRYTFANNAHEIFAAFFGTTSPFADLFSMGSEPPAFYGELTGMQLPLRRTKPPPVRMELSVTLADLYNGAVKASTYTRRVLGEDGTTTDQLTTQQVKVAAGAANNSVVVFESAADEGVDIEPADVEFVLATVADTAWERDGTTLYYTAQVSLVDALCAALLPPLAHHHHRHRHRRRGRGRGRGRCPLPPSPASACVRPTTPLPRPLTRPVPCPHRSGAAGTCRCRLSTAGSYPCP